MPAVAVIGGTLAAGTAAASIAATTLTLVNGLALAGGLATMVGGVTGNKKLMTIGAIATLGAGVAGGFEGLFGASEAASATGLNPSTAISAVDDVGAATGQGLRIASPSAASAAVGGGDLGSQLASLDTGASALSAPSGLPAADLGLGGGGLLATPPPITPTQVGATQTFNTQVANTAVPSAPKLGMSSAGSSSIPTTGISDSVLGTGVRASAASMSTPALETMNQAVQKLGAPDTGASMFSNFGKFLNQNKGLVTLGTGILGGIGQGAMAQEQYKMQQAMDQQRRRELNNAVASIQSRRV